MDFLSGVHACAHNLLPCHRSKTAMVGFRKVLYVYFGLLGDRLGGSSQLRPSFGQRRTVPNLYYRKHRQLRAPLRYQHPDYPKTKQGSEEEEVITTISVAVSTIVTMLIILIGLIPLSIFSTKIVTILAPVSPYVIPAIFGGLGVALLSRYLKLTIIPFIVCLAITITTFALNIDIGQSTMIPIGMAVSIAAAFIIYKKEKK